MGLNSDEDIGEVGLRIQSVGEAGGNERLQDGEVPAGFVVTDKQEVFASQGDPPVILPISVNTFAFGTRGIPMLGAGCPSSISVSTAGS